MNELETFLKGPQDDEGTTTPMKRPAQMTVRPNDKRRNPLKNAEARDAEKAIWDGTQTW